MKFYDMLSSTTHQGKPARKPRNGNTRGPNTKAKYKAFLQQPRTINEIAEEFGYTYYGTHGTIRRYRMAKLVKPFDKVIVADDGRPPTRYIWCGD